MREHHRLWLSSCGEPALPAPVRSPNHRAGLAGLGLAWRPLDPMRVGGVDSADALKSRSAQDLDTSSVPCSCLAIGCSLLQKIDNQVHISSTDRGDHGKYEIPLDSSYLPSAAVLRFSFPFNPIGTAHNPD